ncbi:MAG TPA: hypothetical protein VK666_24145 [Chryseolinea sp.]|nr:hypothetical protein [Chryseolinea sp.]
MKRLAIFFFCSISTHCFSQNEKGKAGDPSLSGKVIQAYMSIEKFEQKFEQSNQTEDQDSVISYNKIFSNLLLSPELRELNNIELKQLAKATGVKISLSKDKKLRILSWSILNLTANPPCNNIAIVDNGSSELIPANGNAEEFGPSIQIDSISQVIGQRGLYILMGSNKCALLCIRKTVSLYKLQEASISKVSRCFFDGKLYSDDVEFSYFMNEQQKAEPYFKIRDRKLLCPIFNEQKTRQVGVKDFSIIVAGR